MKLRIRDTLALCVRFHCVNADVLEHLSKDNVWRKAMQSFESDINGWKPQKLHPLRFSMLDAQGYVYYMDLKSIWRHEFCGNASKSWMRDVFASII